MTFALHSSLHVATMRRAKQNAIHDWAAALPTNNVVTRQLQRSCHALREFDRTTALNTTSISFARGEAVSCYGCSRPCHRTHPVYVFSCQTCGERFQKLRHLTRDMTARVALVVGARTKLGHQVVIKMLEDGATVVGTTRFPAEAFALYEQYADWPRWRDRLRFFPESLDLDTPELGATAARLRDFVATVGGGALDVLVACAAQTIRAREKERPQKQAGDDENRYGDPRHVATDCVNSWHMRLGDVMQREMEEVFRINAVAPAILLQQLAPLLRHSVVAPYVIHVHAREGLFDVDKGDSHVHTNMAKAALAMLTKCVSNNDQLRTTAGVPIRVHGCDPGWISVDEYYEEDRPWRVPPLDEVDGAARVLFPLFKNIAGSCRKTRRHFCHLTY